MSLSATLKRGVGNKISFSDLLLPTMPQLVAILATVALVFLYLRRKNARPRLPLPPGPKGLPVIGNLRDMPTSFEWETYHKWSKEHGTFCFMSFGFN